jgi:S1-C subfamily serine protease
VERDREEWRRPWRDEDTPERTASPGASAAPGTGAAGTWAAPQGGVRTADDARQGGDEPITSYPQPPPAGFGEGHQGPGSPAGSVRPPDTTGTVDAPERDRRRLGLGAVVMAALVGALVATGVTLGMVELLGDDGAGPSGTAAPSIEVDGESAGVVPAVAQAVTPSVVSITIEGAGDGTPFGSPSGPQQGGLGSGVIYRSDGYILTNHHVIDGADTVRVRLSSGDILDAEVIGSDPLNDLAVVQVDTDGEELPAINVRPEDDPVVVGETVVAIGSPFGLEGSVTSGIVSALNRDLTIPDEEQENVGLTIPSIVQTDAAINPGNSGGALVDAKGRLIGINTAILTGTGASQGVGFAVPADQAISSADQLIEQGFVRHPLLGVTGEDITPELAEEFGLEANRGAVVVGVQDDTGAAEAGLEAGDIIVEVNGDPLATMSELVAIVRENDPGDELELVVVRNGEEMTFTVTLSERPR